MLITKQRLIDATELQIWEIRAALVAGGEPDTDNEIKYTSFEGVTASGEFVYRIGFKGENGRRESGFVYLKFVEANNQLVLKATD